MLKTFAQIKVNYDSCFMVYFTCKVYTVYIKKKTFIVFWTDMFGYLKLLLK